MAEHATQAVRAMGTQLLRGGLLETDPFVNLMEVTNFDPADAVADEIEVTHYESPNGDKEFIAGGVDNGEATLSLNWNPGVYASHNSIRSDKADRLLRWYKCILPGAMETITFRAFVKGLKRNIDRDGAVTADVTFRVSTSNAA